MSIDTNLNVSPYFDDFDENKNFHRILFRPSVAVQARELTQLQTILQNQIERFGDNIFRTGTIIKGCSLSSDYSYYYIKIRDNQVDGQPVSLTNYANTLLIQSSSNLQAYVVNSKTGLESQDPDLNTLYVKYLNTGTSGEKTFSNNQVVTIYDRDRTVESIAVTNGGTGYDNTDVVVISGGDGAGATAELTTYANGTIQEITMTNKGSGYTSNPSVSITTSTGSSAVLTPQIYIAEIRVANSSFTSPVGTGAAIKVTDGIIYQKGHFIRVDAQEEILSKYTTLPSNVAVGFTVSEAVVNSSVDTTLLDNATGTSNYTAPGAHRLKLTPLLTVIPRTAAEANSDFLSLLEFEDGAVVKDRSATQFNSVRSELSKRTFEESGNYVVNQIPLNTAEISGNTTHFNLIVGAGVAYVDGNRIETLNNIKVPVRKGTDVANAVSQTIATTYGNYVLIKEMLGVFEIKNGTTVTLRNTAGTDITDNSGGTPSLPGTQIGTAKVRSLEYDSGTPGTPDCVYKLFLFDVKLASGYSFKSVRSIALSGTAVADVVLTNGEAVLEDFDNDILVFSSGATAVKEFNSEEFIFRTSTSGTFSTSGNLSLSFSGGNTLPYGVGTLSKTVKNQFVVVPTTTLVSDTNKSGTIAVANGTQTNVAGTSTLFTSEYQIGDYIKIGTKNPLRIVRIYNDSLMQLASAPGTATANVHTISYPANVPVDMGKRGKVIQITSNTGVTFSLGHGTTATGSATIYHDMQNFEPSVKQKSVNSPIYVKVSRNSLKKNLRGPWCLGIPDVYQIDGVYVGTGTSYAATTSTNYRDQFVLDNGQRDNYYGLAYLSKKPGSTLNLTTNSTLLVKLKSFTHGSGKYLSTESYPINDDTVTFDETSDVKTEQIPVFFSPASGEAISLRDALDFRPIVANTANLSSTTAGATIDPVPTETLVSGEKFFPSPSKSFQATIQYYLKRIDRLVMNSDGRIKVEEGNPEVSPSAPPAVKGSMDLGLILVAPFPSLSAKESDTALRPDLANQIKYMQTRRFTMDDIGDLEKRVSRIEYYTTLSSIEANTKNLTLFSEANNQVERFKNGFFVDGFSNYDISNTNDPEYLAAIESTNSRLTPLKSTFDIPMVYSSTTGTKKGDLVVLPYSEKTLVSQPYATKERTLVEEYWSFKGKAQVFPRVDNFFDPDISATSVINVDVATPIQSLVKSINTALKTATSGSELVSSNTSVGQVTFNGRQFSQTTTVTNEYSDYNTQIVGKPATSTTSEVGNFLTNVSMNPYIRAQKIAMYVSGLRPGAEHFVFFDGVNLSSNTVPASITDFSDEVTLSDFTYTGKKGAALTANNTGELAFVINLPANTFTTGEKDILVMDFNSLASETSATSKAVGKFTSFGLSGDATRTTFTTKNFDTATPDIFAAQVYSTARREVLSSTQTWEPPAPDVQRDSGDPLAQTFRAQSQAYASAFIFLTSVSVYFSKKDSKYGVTMEIREVDPSGYPTKKIIGKKYLKSSQISTSATGATATTFTFDSPLTLKIDNEYAMVLVPDANSPDYRIWTAETGAPDVSNPSLISNQSWGLGTMFYSVTGSTFTAVQNEDWKFVARYASFSASSSLVMKNRDFEYLTVANAAGTFVGGEDVAQLSTSYVNSTLTVNSASRVISTSTNLSSTLNINDYIVIVYGTSRVLAANVIVSGTTVTNTSASSFDTTFTAGDFITIGNTTNQEVRQITAVTNATSMTIDATTFNTFSNHEAYSITPLFDVVRVKAANSTTITVDRLPSVNTSTTVASSFQKAVRGAVTRYNSQDDVLYLADSNASNSSFLFRTSNSTYMGTIVGGDSNARAKVSSIDNLSISSFKPLISTLNLKNTSLNVTGTFTKSAGGSHTQLVQLNKENTFTTDDEIVVKSKSNEISGTTVNKSLSMTFSLSSSAKDTSPVVDVSPASIVGHNYRVNNDSSNENTRFGNAQAKYVSKKLVLNEGLDAEDVKVYLTGFKPIGTELLVYAKVLNSADGEPFDNKDWTLLQQTSPAVFSSSLNTNDLKEFEYTFRYTPTSSVLPGAVQSFSNSTIEGSNTQFTASFNANSSVNATANFITISSNKYEDGDLLTYVVDSGNTVIAELDQEIGSEVSTVSINTAGTGYVNGDIVSVVGGTGLSAKFVVTTGAADTIPASLALYNRGKYSVSPGTSNVSTDAEIGSGSGLTVDLTIRTLHGPYYVVSSNTSGVKLSLTSDGSAIDIEKGVTESGHYLNILTTGDLVKVVKSDTLYDYEIFPVGAVIDANTVIVSGDVSHTTSGMEFEKATIPNEAFKYSQNPTGNNVVRYYDSNHVAFDTYKVLALKIVMLADNNYLVPIVNDVRAIAVSV